MLYVPNIIYQYSQNIVIKLARNIFLKLVKNTFKAAMKVIISLIKDYNCMSINYKK